MGYNPSSRSGCAIYGSPASWSGSKALAIRIGSGFSNTKINYKIDKNLNIQYSARYRTVPCLSRYLLCQYVLGSVKFQPTVVRHQRMISIRIRNHMGTGLTWSGSGGKMLGPDLDSYPDQKHSLQPTDVIIKNRNIKRQAPKYFSPNFRIVQKGRLARCLYLHFLKPDDF